MGYGLALGNALFGLPPQSELNDLIQPIFEYLQEKHPEAVLIIRNNSAELLTEINEVALYNKKLYDNFFLSPETFGLTTKFMQDLSELMPKNIEVKDDL